MENHWHEILGFLLLVLYFVISSFSKKKNQPQQRARVPQEPQIKRRQRVAPALAEAVESPPEIVVELESSIKGVKKRSKVIARSDLKRAILLKEVLSRPKSQIFEE